MAEYRQQTQCSTAVQKNTFLFHVSLQVCAHIVQAIRKETVRAREEWESGLSCRIVGTPGTPEEVQHNPSDIYCFEMLSMVLALSGSAVGRAHLSQQDHLLRHLLSLLHTGSARVQRQVSLCISCLFCCYFTY